MQIRGQTDESLLKHNPVNCSKIPDKWGKENYDCPIPVFAGSSPVVCL